MGLANALSVVTSASPKPPKSAGEKVEDEGDGGGKIAAFLVGAEAHLRPTTREGTAMAEVLVLVDHVEGEIKKATYELLTAARRRWASRRRSWSGRRVPPGSWPRG